jgi:seryl-tRNA synthetase
MTLSEKNVMSWSRYKLYDLEIWLDYSETSTCSTIFHLH